MGVIKGRKALFYQQRYPPDGLLTPELRVYDVEERHYKKSPDPSTSDDLSVFFLNDLLNRNTTDELNNMNTGEDETSSGLNGRLRPRKSNVLVTQNNRVGRKSDTKSTPEPRPKRTVNPSKATPPKTDDLFTKSDDTPTLQLLCPYCDKKFTCKQNVSKHVRRVHIPALKQDISISCLLCAHTDRDPSDIIRHMVDNHPNQYFACLDCNTRFSSTTELADHKLIVCEKQKPSFSVKTRQKISPKPKKSQKSLCAPAKDGFRTDVKEFPDSHGFNGIVISCEIKPSLDGYYGTDIEENITTNLILPPNKSLSNAVKDKNAVIVLDDIQWTKRLPPNFSFNNTDADQILSRLGVVHKSPRGGETTKKDWLKIIDEANQKFERCFDTSFYSKVASNVQENLNKFLDGSFNFNPDPDAMIKTRKSKFSVVINTAEGFPILLASEQFSRNVYERYMPRSIAPKHKWKWESVESNRNALNPDQIKRDSHTNNCIITLVSSLDIWTQLCMRRKYDDKYNTTPIEKKTERQNIIGLELKEILESRDLPSTSCTTVAKIATKTTICEGEVPPAWLGLQAAETVAAPAPAVLSGEWVRPRCYVCCACGAQTSDPRAVSTHINTHHPNAQVQHYEIVGERLLNSDILKHLYVPPSQSINRTRPPRGFRDCTKCNKSISLEVLHHHMLECAGDTPAVRRKVRPRPFGARRRRPRLPDNTIRKKLRKELRPRHTTRQKNRLQRARAKLRSEVGDAETIRKMIADLPAKRHRVMINPSNSLAIRSKRIMDKQQRNKLIMKRRATEELRNRRIRIARNTGAGSSVVPPKKAVLQKNHSNEEEEDSKPLKPRLVRMNTRRMEALKTNKQKLLANKPRNPVRTKEKKVIDNDEPDDDKQGTEDKSLDIVIENLSVGNNTQKKIDVSGGESSEGRQHGSRGTPTRGEGSAPNRSGNSGGDAPSRNGNNSNNPPQNTAPLKHSIASLCGSSETHDKSVQFQPMFLVQQECNNLSQHVPTGQQLLFENEAVVTKLDKPPLAYDYKGGTDDRATLDMHLLKNKQNNKPRKGLNDCIAMLKNKLVAPLPQMHHGHVSVQCGSDEPMEPYAAIPNKINDLNNLSPQTKTSNLQPSPPINSIDQIRYIDTRETISFDNMTNFPLQMPVFSPQFLQPPPRKSPDPVFKSPPKRGAKNCKITPKKRAVQVYPRRESIRRKAAIRAESEIQKQKLSDLTAQIQAFTPKLSDFCVVRQVVQPKSKPEKNIKEKFVTAEKKPKSVQKLIQEQIRAQEQIKALEAFVRPMDSLSVKTFHDKSEDIQMQNMQQFSTRYSPTEILPKRMRAASTPRNLEPTNQYPDKAGMRRNSFEVSSQYHANSYQLSPKLQVHNVINYCPKEAGSDFHNFSREELYKYQYSPRDDINLLYYSTMEERKQGRISPRTENSSKLHFMCQDEKSQIHHSPIETTAEIHFSPKGTRIQCSSQETNISMMSPKERTLGDHCSPKENNNKIHPPKAVRTDMYLLPKDKRLESNRSSNNTYNDFSPSPKDMSNIGCDNEISSDLQPPRPNSQLSSREMGTCSQASQKVFEEVQELQPMHSQTFVEDQFHMIPRAPPAHASTQAYSMVVAPLDLSGKSADGNELMMPDEMIPVEHYDEIGTLDLSNKRAEAERHLQDTEMVVDLRVKTHSAHQYEQVYSETEENYMPTDLCTKNKPFDTVQQETHITKEYVHNLSAHKSAYAIPIVSVTDYSEVPAKSIYLDQDYIPNTNDAYTEISMDLSKKGNSEEVLSTHSTSLKETNESELDTKNVDPISEISEERLVKNCDDSVMVSQFHMRADLESRKEKDADSRKDEEKMPCEPQISRPTLMQVLNTENKQTLPHPSLKSEVPTSITLLNPIKNCENMQPKLHSAVVSASKSESTGPFFTLENACVPVTANEPSNMKTLPLVSINATTGVNTASAYTLAETTLSSPVHYSGLSDKACNSKSNLILEKESSDQTDACSPKQTINIDQDPEVAKKIEMLPKELVEVLGNMPRDHRNKLLNILPQYVSITSPQSTDKGQNTATTSLSVAAGSISVSNKENPTNDSVDMDVNFQSSIKNESGYNLSTNQLKNVVNYVKEVPLTTGDKSFPNNVIDLTEDETISNNSAVSVTLELNLTPFIEPCATAKKPKSNNEKTASLRAVRIKTASERIKSANIQPVATAEQNTPEIIPVLNANSAIITFDGKRSPAIQQAEISSTQHKTTGTTIISPTILPKQTLDEINNIPVISVVPENFTENTVESAESPQQLNTKIISASSGQEEVKVEENLDNLSEIPVDKVSNVEVIVEDIKEKTVEKSEENIKENNLIKQNVSEENDLKENLAPSVNTVFNDSVNDSNLKSSQAIIDKPIDNFPVKSNQEIFDENKEQQEETPKKDLNSSSENPINPDDDSEDDVSLAVIVKQKQDIASEVAMNSIKAPVAAIHNTQNIEPPPDVPLVQTTQKNDNLVNIVDLVVSNDVILDKKKKRKTRKSKGSALKNSNTTNIVEPVLISETLVEKPIIDDYQLEHNENTDTVMKEIDCKVKHAKKKFRKGRTPKVKDLPSNYNKVIKKGTQIEKTKSHENVLDQNNADDIINISLLQSEVSPESAIPETKDEIAGDQHFEEIVSKNLINEPKLELEGQKLEKNDVIEKDSETGQIKNISDTHDSGPVEDLSKTSQIKCKESDNDKSEMSVKKNDCFVKRDSDPIANFRSTDFDIDNSNTLKPLRRSRRGKSLFVDSSQAEYDFTQVLDVKAPFTKKQLIFSKLLHDEEQSTKVVETVDSATGKLKTEIEILQSPITCLNLIESDKSLENVLKTKSTKRKKSPHTKQKSKKKKIDSNQLNDEPKSENSETMNDDQMTNLTGSQGVELKNKNIESELENLKYQDCDKKIILNKDSFEATDGPICKTLSSAGKRKPNPQNNGDQQEFKKIRTCRTGLRPFFVERCDDKTNECPEIRSTCYSQAVNVIRRTRPKSVEKSSSLEKYDPYDIDLDEMIEKPESVKKNINPKVRSAKHSKTKRNCSKTKTSKIKKTEKENVNIDETFVKDVSKIEDSGDSSQSDVPLRKYVEEKESQSKLKKSKVELDVKSDIGLMGLEKGSDVLSPQIDSEKHSRSEKFMESFGFFSERKPRKSNLLASKKISETFHIIESDECPIKKRDEKKKSHESKKSKEGARSSHRTSTQKRSKPEIIPAKQVREKSTRTACYCVLCKKIFRRPDNFLRHQMTLYHVLKLAEIELKLEIRAPPEKPNHLVILKQELDKFMIRKSKEVVRRNKNGKRVKEKSSGLKEIYAKVLEIVKEKQEIAINDLNRDEALFLDCCELLKEYRQKGVVRVYLDNNTISICPYEQIGRITEDDDVDSITARNILESEEVRTLENDLISGLKEAANQKLKFQQYHDTSIYGNLINEAKISALCGMDYIINNVPPPPKPNTSRPIEYTDRIHLSTTLQIPRRKPPGVTPSLQRPFAALQASTSRGSITPIEEISSLMSKSHHNDNPKPGTSHGAHANKYSISCIDPKPGTSKQTECRNIKKTNKRSKKEPKASTSKELCKSYPSPNCSESAMDVSETKESFKYPEYKEKMYPDILIEDIDMMEDKFDKIKRKCRSQAAAAKQNQCVIELNTSQKARKKSDNKKVKKRSKKNLQNAVLTKGALKGFEGIKVSIPSSDINVSALVRDNTTKKKKKNSSKKRRDQRNSVSSGKTDSDHRAKDSSQKKLDVYEFMDNEDAELFEFRPSTLMERFKSMSSKDNENTWKPNAAAEDAEMTTESGTDEDDFVYMSEDYVCSDDETENSLLSCDLANKQNVDAKKTSSPVKRKEAVDKSAVMGKIFKNNAVRSDKKSVKTKETIKSKTNLDQLFDSLLQTESEAHKLEKAEPSAEALEVSMQNNESKKSEESSSKTFVETSTQYEPLLIETETGSPKKNELLVSKYLSSPPVEKLLTTSRRTTSISPRIRAATPKKIENPSLTNSPTRISNDLLDDIPPMVTSKFKKYSLSPSKLFSRKFDSSFETSSSHDRAAASYEDYSFSDAEEPTFKNHSSKSKLSKEELPFKGDANASGAFDFTEEGMEDAGVARQRARRKCTVGKQNVLAETWSSESEPDGAARPGSAASAASGGARRRRARRRDGPGARRRPRRAAPPAPAPPPPWPADAPEHLQQHGWIVGDSHKKLVTMLAHAKGRKRSSDADGNDID